jgi:hypothetical protein
MLKESKLALALKAIRRTHSVEKLPSGKWFVNWGGGNPEYQDYYIYTDRELIARAREMGHESRQKTAIKKNIKEESKRERRYVRDEINKNGEDADTDFPKRAFADRWNWD